MSRLTSIFINTLIWVRRYLGLVWAGMSLRGIPNP